MPPRAACYLRISTSGQDEENQAPDLHRICDARGWEPIEYREVASGARDDRPELARVMDAARRGEIAGVVVWSLSRLHRSMARTVRDVLELDRLGVAVVSHRETWLDTTGPARGLLVAIFGWLFEQERAELIARTRAGLDRARRTGTRSGRPIGRPRASRVLLHAAADLVAAGSPIRAAARAKGVRETTLRRFMRSLGNAAPRG